VRRAVIVLLAGAGAVVGVAQPARAASTPVDAGIYTLASGASGKCVDVTGASTANSALLIQVACAATTTHQQWRTTEHGAGQFNLVNVNSGRCIDVPSAATTSGLQLQQYGCGDGTKTNQLWTFTASTATPGKYLVKSVATGLCVSDLGGSTAGNNPIVQENCSDIARMQWNFTSVSGSSGTATVASDGTGTYKTVQAAIDAVPTGNAGRVVITIKPGTYREIVTVPSTKPYISLQGLGSSPSSTVIVDNHSSAGGYGTSGSATLFANGAGFQASNLTIANDYGVGSQAVALNLNADKIILDNVRILGNQDTLLTNTGRAYVVNSYIEGTVDFIFGGSVAVFYDSRIHEISSTGGVLTAANTDAAKTYGYLFYKCVIDNGGGTDVTNLGRPWGAAAQVLFRESSMTAGIKYSQPWTDMSSNTWENARFFEYRNTGAGATINSNRPQLTDAQAADYTPQKYLAGADGWDPV
jgi:pectinesterase